MRGDIYEILSKLGFENDPLDKSFRVIKNDIVVSLSISNVPNSIPKSTTSIFLIEKITKDYTGTTGDPGDIIEETSDVVIMEVFINSINYDLIRSHILRFFQSDIREKSLTYLLDK